jgi:predicted small lipoprotein YifL
MKKAILLVLALVLTLSLAACGGKDKNGNLPDSESPGNGISQEDSSPGNNSTSNGGRIVTDIHRDATSEGFPDSDVFSECAFDFTLSPPTVQTKYSYTSSYHYDAIPGDDGTIYIYLFKNYSAEEWGDLSWNDEEYTLIVNEVSQQSGIPLKSAGNEYTGPEPYDSGGEDYPYISIKLVGNYVEIVVGWVRHAG